MSLYEEAKKVMKPEEIDHWQSDLYLRDEVEHRPWFDIPFEYKPWWDEKEKI